MLIDKPTPKDYLGFSPYVKGIENLIRRTKPDDLPIAVGIYGAWGSGKTSFMLQLRNCLETNRRRGVLPTIWFEAWKYDSTYDARSALIYKIILELRDRAERGAKRKVANAAKNVFKATVALVAHSRLSAGIPQAGLQLPSAAELNELMDEAKKFQTTVDRLEDDFSRTVQAFLDELPSRVQKLVVFIDDLDRCLPHNAITILEALKLFLDKSRCVFVIGVDRTVVEKAIQAHYGTDPGISGRDYLDKIIQYPFDLPPADPSRLEKCFGKLHSVRDLNEACRGVVTLAAEGNPRIYLRLINAWHVVSSLATHLAPELQEDNHKHIMMIATATQIRFPALHELCRRNPKGMHVLLDYCNTRPSKGGAAGLLGDNWPGYAQFWENTSVRHFLSGLSGVTGRGNVDQILGPESLTRAAFGLSARVA